MTSSLPDFSSSPVNPPAAGAASLGAQLPAGGHDAGSAPDANAGFAALMGASSGPSAAPAPAAVPVPPAVVISGANPPTRMLSDPVVAASVAGTPVQPALSVFVLNDVMALSALEPAAPADPAALSTAPSTVPGRREITRDMLEAAASFVTSLLQAALPEVQAPQFSTVAANRETVSGGASGPPAGVTADLSQAGAADATPRPLIPNQSPAAAVFTLASDGAIELKLDLAQLRPAGLKLDLPADQTLTVNAELHRPGEIVVRLEAAGTVPAPEGPSPATASGRAIFAVRNPGMKSFPDAPVPLAERNFVFTGDKQVKTQAPVAGISVAQTDSTMPAATSQESRFSRHPELFSALSQRSEFQVVVPAAERVTAPADAPAAQNFAERAVDTVTSLVDTQFSASLQKSGSVQLRLRFGGEDLSVRVELRDGAVHTDFQTDSPELRTALAREWQALAAQSPEQMRRYLDPVFSPHASTSPASSDTPSSFSRQQQPSQQDLPSRTPRDPWVESASPFARRSQLSGSFTPVAAVTRGPSYLPTTLRLSALA